MKKAQTDKNFSDSQVSLNHKKEKLELKTEEEIKDVETTESLSDLKVTDKQELKDYDTYSREFLQLCQNKGKGVVGKWTKPINCYDFTRNMLRGFSGDELLEKVFNDFALYKAMSRQPKEFESLVVCNTDGLLCYTLYYSMYNIEEKEILILTKTFEEVERCEAYMRRKYSLLVSIYQHKDFQNYFSQKFKELEEKIKSMFVYKNLNIPNVSMCVKNDMIEKFNEDILKAAHRYGFEKCDHRDIFYACYAMKKYLSLYNIVFF
ncbi:hypothetical protein AB837_00561 [bacterium AB1]|nr:hypothetical protein AB837_00561 [bacterium AB1]